MKRSVQPLLVSSAVAAVMLVGMRALPADPAAVRDGVRNDPQGELQAEEQRAIQAAVERVAPSTVRIEVIGLADGSEAAAGAGPSTGLVVGADGWIVTTSFAVTEEAVELVAVLPDGTRRPAKVVGRDRSTTIVLLKIDPPSPLPVPPLSPKADLRVGQWAVALGRAWNSSSTSVSVGVISALERGWGRAVQTDAAVSPANYGGPLVDIAGRVIGVLAPIPADTAGMNVGTELYDSGIGFAVPLSDILARLPTMQRGRTIAPGLLGISYASRDPFTQPAVIATARAGSPAAKAGIRSGDRIVEANGTKVTRIAELRHVLAGLAAGDSVKLAVERGAGGGDEPGGPRRIEKEIALVEALPPYRRPCLGIGLERAEKAVPAADGLRVAWVWPEGPAAKADVRPGDRVRSIEPVRAAEPDDAAGEKPDISPAILAGVVAEGEVGSSFRVVVERDGEERSIEVVAQAVPVTLPDPTSTLAGERGRGEAGVTIERLQAADLPEGPLAVLPAESPSPIGVLVFLAGGRKDAMAAAAQWRKAVGDSNVAVLLPTSANPMRWSDDDLPGIVKGLRALAKSRTLDRSRVAVAGMQSGGAFVWSLANALEGAARGVALLDAGLPRRGAVPTADPARPLSVLLARPLPDAEKADDARRRFESDVDRLQKTGLPFGLLPAPIADPPPFESLCLWVESLGML